MSHKNISKQLDSINNLISIAGKQQDVMNSMMEKTSEKLTGSDKAKMEKLKAMSNRMFNKAAKGDNSFTDIIEEIKTEFKTT